MRIIERDKQATSYLIKELNQLDNATKKIENSGVSNLAFNINIPDDLIDYSSNTLINSIDAEKFDQVINFLKTQRKEFRTLTYSTSSLTLVSNTSGEVSADEDVDIESSKTKTVIDLIVPQNWDGRNSFVTIDRSEEIVSMALSHKNSNDKGTAGATIMKNERSITVILYHNCKSFTLPSLKIEALLWRTI